MASVCRYNSLIIAFFKNNLDACRTIRVVVSLKFQLLIDAIQFSFVKVDVRIVIFKNWVKAEVLFVTRQSKLLIRAIMYRKLGSSFLSLMTPLIQTSKNPPIAWILNRVWI